MALRIWVKRPLPFVLSLEWVRSVDKAGGAVPEPTRTLTLLNPRSGVEVEPFVDEVAKLSGGALVVEQGEQFERGSPDSEVEEIKAVQAGSTDLAVVPVRAFGLIGMRSFDALIAPMEIDSMSLQQQGAEQRHSD